MYCKKCGKQITGKSQYCVACKPKGVPSGNTRQMAKKKNGKKVMLTVGVVVLGLLLIAVILNLTGVGEKLWHKDDNSQSASKPGEGNTDKENGTNSGNVMDKDSYTVENAEAEEKKDVVIATLGNQKLTNGELQAYYWHLVYDYVKSMYSNQTETETLDISKPLDEQYYPDTGRTYQQWFLERALATWKSRAIIVQLAEESNFQLPADQQAELDGLEAKLTNLMTEHGYTDAEQFIDEQFFPGTSLDLYLKCSKTNYIAGVYYEHLYDSVKIAEGELEAYYVTHATEFVGGNFDKSAGDGYDVRHILIGIEGDANADGEYTDAQWAACKARAESLLEEFKNGAATEEAFAQLAKEHSQDPGSSENGGLYSGLTKNNAFIEPFKNWYLDSSRKPGDTGLVKNTESAVQGYHIMYFAGSAPLWEMEAEKGIRTGEADGKCAEVEKRCSIKVDYKNIVISTVKLAGE